MPAHQPCARVCAACELSVYVRCGQADERVSDAVADSAEEEQEEDEEEQEEQNEQDEELVEEQQEEQIEEAAVGAGGRPSRRAAKRKQSCLLLWKKLQCHSYHIHSIKMLLCREQVQ